MSVCRQFDAHSKPRSARPRFGSALLPRVRCSRARGARGAQLSSSPQLPAICSSCDTSPPPFLPYTQQSVSSGRATPTRPAPSEPPTKLTRAGQRGQKATLQRRPLNRRGRPAQRPWKDLSAPSTVRAVSDGESKRPAPFCKAQQLATARSSPSLVRVGFHNGGPRAQGPPEPCGRLWRPSGGCLHLRPASTRGDYGQRKLALLGAP